MQEKQNEYDEKRKEEETRKMKVDSKQKILEDMQNKILSYKTEILKNRNKKDWEKKFEVKFFWNYHL